MLPCVACTARGPAQPKKAVPEGGPFFVQLPATGAEAEAYARTAAVIAVSAIIIAGPAVVSVAPAHHVAIIAAVVALHVARTAGPEAATVLVADQADLVDAGNLRRTDRGGIERSGRRRRRECRSRDRGSGPVTNNKRLFI